MAHQEHDLEVKQQHLEEKIQDLEPKRPQSAHKMSRGTGTSSVDLWKESEQRIRGLVNDEVLALWKQIKDIKEKVGLV